MDIKDEIKRQARAEMCRRSAWEFCLFYDKQFFQKRPFLKVVADTFQALIEGDDCPDQIKEDIESSEFINTFNGKFKKASVSMPPRAGKSYVISVCSAWGLGKYPQESLMRNTCTITLYRKFSYDVREIIKSSQFSEVFHVELSPDKQNVEGWNTTESKQVGYFGSGTGGTIIGFGASLIAITDDLYKDMESALSPVIQEKTQSWYDSAHGSRLEKGCPEFDVGTRWSKNDVLGKNEQSDEYDITIKIPALIDGESFCEDVKTTEEYIKIKNRIDDVIWQSEYQQNPIEAKGILFPIQELKKFSLSDLDESKVESKNCYIDIADEGDDFHCCVGSMNIGSDIYITDVVFTREDTTINVPLTASVINKMSPEFVRIETNSGGTMYPQLLEQHINDSVTLLPVKNSSNKHTRILTISAMVKNYCHFRDDYDEGSDYAKFMNNLTQYLKDGKSKHDDAPDSIAGLVQFIVNFLTHLYE